MTQYRSAANGPSPPTNHSRHALSHYERLGVARTASEAEIRQAYRQKSKLYHPDTTPLPPEEAAEQFRQLNEAYATLSNVEQRQRYDRAVTTPRVPRPTQGGKPIPRPPSSRPSQTSGTVNLDAKQRPLSAGEVFALFLLGITFVGCLVLALFLGAKRSDHWWQTSPLAAQWQHSLQQFRDNLSVFDLPRTPATTPRMPPEPLTAPDLPRTPATPPRIPPDLLADPDLKPQSPSEPKLESGESSSE